MAELEQAMAEQSSTASGTGEGATTQCPYGTAPRFDRFDPLIPEQRGDPGPVLEEARRAAPVFYMPKHGMYCVTRYEDATRIFREEDIFSTSGSDATVVPMPPELAADLPRGHPVSNSLHDMDAEAHTRIRQLVQRPFSARQTAPWSQVVAGIADKLVDAFPGDGEIDMVRDFAGPIPSRVIAELLGFPIEDADQLQHWTDEFFILSGNGQLPKDVGDRLWAGAAEFASYIRTQVRHRREHLADDLTSKLLAARSDDGSSSLTDDELVYTIAGLIAAASDTTTVLICETVMLLLRNAGWWERVRQDHSLIDKAIDETLRLRSPVRGLRRLTKADVTVGDVLIPEGSVVYISLISVNQDGQEFVRPEEFEPGRPDLKKHLGLGVGRHYCVGASLARVETRTAIERLVRRVEEMVLIEHELEYSATSYVPALKSLRVRVRTDQGGVG
jgi:cytochrome P450